MTAPPYAAGNVGHLAAHNHAATARANVLDYGAVGDGVADDSAAIQSACDALPVSGGVVYFPPGTYRNVAIAARDGLTIAGAGPAATILRAKAGTPVIDAVAGVNNLTVRDLTIDAKDPVGTGGTGIRAVGTTANPVRGVLVDNVTVDLTAATVGNGIRLEGDAGDVTIRACAFLGNRAPDVTVPYYDSQIHVYVPVFADAGRSNPIRVTGCRFDGAGSAVAYAGSFRPASPIWVTNNYIEAAQIHGVMLYRAVQTVLAGNVFESCRSRLGPVPGHDGAVVWLDTYSPDVLGDLDGNVFADNIIRNSTGNAVYIEECVDAIRGFSILGVAKRPAGETYQARTTGGGFGVLSRGGNGIVLTGGCVDTPIIGCRIVGCEGSGIVFDRALGVHSEYAVSGSVIGCTIVKNQEHGIRVDHQVRELVVQASTIVGNGLADPTWVTKSYAAIYITRTSGEAAETGPRLIVQGCKFQSQARSGGGEVEGQRHAIWRDYSGGNFTVIGNTIATAGGEWVKVSSANLRVAYNQLLSSRGFSTTGANTEINHNEGYINRTDSQQSVTGSKVVAHGLAAAPSLYAATLVGASPGIVTIDSVDATNVTIRVFKLDGTAETVARTVAFTAWGGDYGAPF